MLFNIYKALKDQLRTPANPGKEGIKLPNEWYNMQYEGTMINERGMFIEFPKALKFEAVSNTMRRTPVKIRVHFYSKVIQTSDGIPDEVVQDHEAVALTIQDLLDGFTPEDKSCGRLTFSGWQHWHKWKGWMVTFVEFDAKKTL